MKKLILIIQLVAISCFAAAQKQYIEGGVFRIDNTLTLMSNMSPWSFVINDKARENDQVPMWDPVWNTFSRKNGKIVSNANMLKAFTESFTQAQINDLAAKGEEITVYVNWNNSGDIIDVGFGMADNINMQSISPATYGALFKKLKQYVKFKIVSPSYNQPYYNAEFYIKFDNIKRGYIDYD